MINFIQQFYNISCGEFLFQVGIGFKLFQSFVIIKCGECVVGVVFIFMKVKIYLVVKIIIERKVYQLGMKIIVGCIIGYCLFNYFYQVLGRFRYVYQYNLLIIVFRKVIVIGNLIIIFLLGIDKVKIGGNLVRSYVFYYYDGVFCWYIVLFVKCFYIVQGDLGDSFCGVVGRQFNMVFIVL